MLFERVFLMIRVNISVFQFNFKLLKDEEHVQLVTSHKNDQNTTTDTFYSTRSNCFIILAQRSNAKQQSNKYDLLLINRSQLQIYIVNNAIIQIK